MKRRLPAPQALSVLLHAAALTWIAFGPRSSVSSTAGSGPRVLYFETRPPVPLADPPAVRPRPRIRWEAPRALASRLAAPRLPSIPPPPVARTMPPAIAAEAPAFPAIPPRIAPAAESFSAASTSIPPPQSRTAAVREAGFAAAAAPAPAAVPRPGTAASAEFGAAAPAANAPRTAVPQDAGFETAATAGAAKRAKTQEAGFSTTPEPVAAAASSRARRVALSAEFGASAEPVLVASREPVIAAAGFAAATTVRPAGTPATTTTAPLSRALEILEKPRPAYTAEARRLQIEGEVVLEAEFPAAGAVRVLRVVRGLGHGLDEAAIAAARSIRFRPAERQGAPAATIAQVRIAFQLAF